MFGLHLIKPELVLLYPLSILSGTGIYYLFYKKNIIKNRNLIQVLILFYLIIGAVASTNSVITRANNRYKLV